MSKLNLIPADQFVEIKTKSGRILSARFNKEKNTFTSGSEIFSPEDLFSANDLNIEWGFLEWTQKDESLASIVGYDDFGWKYTGGGLIVLEDVEEIYEIDNEREFIGMPEPGEISIEHVAVNSPLVKAFNYTRLADDKTRITLGRILWKAFREADYDRACEILGIAKALDVPQLLRFFEACEPERFTSGRYVPEWINKAAEAIDNTLN